MIRMTHKLHTAMACKSTCESIVCYGHADSAQEYLDKNEKYFKSYIKDLGEDTVLDILTNVINSVDHIEENTITDSEGVSYNHIVFKPGYMTSSDIDKAMCKLWDETVGYKK